MSLLDSIPSFIEGVKSVIDVSGAVRDTLSDAVSGGIVRAFKRIKKPLEQTAMRIAFMLVSLFFIAWGAALLIDNFVPYKGLGFVIVGACFGVVILLFLKEKESD